MSNNQQGPDGEAGEFAYAEEKDGLDCGGAEKAEGQGHDVAQKRHPAYQRHPDTVPVDIHLLPDHRFRLDLEVLFYPLPLSEPAYEICGDAAQPIAGGADNKRGHRADSGGQRCNIKGIRTERQDSRRQKGSYEKAKKAYVLESEQIIRGRLRYRGGPCLQEPRALHRRLC